jgi:hypothetical protein
MQTEQQIELPGIVPEGPSAESTRIKKHGGKRPGAGELPKVKGATACDVPKTSGFATA